VPSDTPAPARTLAPVSAPRPTSVARTSTRRIAVALVAVVVIGLVGFARGAEPAHAATTLSQGATATASSTGAAGYGPEKAVDGSTATRWSSLPTSVQWISIDLGGQANLAAVSLSWSAAYATSFRLQLSTDGSTWTTGYSTQKATGGVMAVRLTGTARYVRMLALVPGTKWGYSLTEFRVVGTLVPTPSATGVHLTGSQANWQLTVDGRPYFVKAVTYDPAVMDPATSLPDVRRLGANTVRDWGTDDNALTASFFAAAQQNGIRVIAGFWLDTNQNWLTNTAYQNQQLATITSTVAKYKDSSAVLMWDVGNEVMLNASSDAQRVAYAQYIERVTKAIHQIDPNHPVTSTDAITGYWNFYQQYAPSLDVLGLNTYSGIAGAQSYWETGNDGRAFTKPYILTETGPLGWWAGESPQDANGQTLQPSDTATAQHYVDAWNSILDAKGEDLGGAMFHYTNETDIQATWFSINPGGLTRASYYALASIWGGSVGSDRPPVVSSMTVPATVTAGRPFTISAPATDPDGDAMTWSVEDTSSTLAELVHATTVASSGANGTLTVTAPTQTGVWRFYVYVTDGHGNVDIESRTLKVVAPAP
jgi:hypothetical protein